MYRVPLGKARVMRSGKDVTIVGASYMALEALRAADLLAAEGISAEAVDLRSLRPLDAETIVQSVRKTGRLVVADHSWREFGTASEIVALASERAFTALKAAPVRIALPDSPVPSSPALADSYYPRAPHIVAAVNRMLGRRVDPASFAVPPGRRLDQPDPSFTGPF
jgi:pyruvate dehydrogenase E1 component beta subunit